MAFVDNLLTLKANVAPQVLKDYEFYVFPHGQQPTFERLRTLLNPGERSNKQLVMELIGGQLAGLEAHFSEAGLPIILPTADEKDFPSSLKTVAFKPLADMEAILYDYIECWKTRGNPEVLNGLFYFDKIPAVPRAYDLGHGLRFNPLLNTLGQAKIGRDIVYNSRVEKIVYSGDYDLYITYRLVHHANILREVLSSTVRYWIHDSSNHVDAMNEDQRPAHGEFTVRRQGRGDKFQYAGYIGMVDLRNNHSYKKSAEFSRDGFLVNPFTKTTQKSTKNGRPLQCDFNNTLKQLVDAILVGDGGYLRLLAGLGYVHFKP